MHTRDVQIQNHFQIIYFIDLKKKEVKKKQAPRMLFEEKNDIRVERATLIHQNYSSYSGPW